MSGFVAMLGTYLYNFYYDLFYNAKNNLSVFHHKFINIINGSCIYACDAAQVIEVESRAALINDAFELAR